MRWYIGWDPRGAAAFEVAVIGGEDLQDVLDGLLHDLSRVGIRSFVTAPLAAATEGLAGRSLAGFGEFFSLGGILGDLLGFARGGAVGGAVGSTVGGGGLGFLQGAAGDALHVSVHARI